MKTKLTKQERDLLLPNVAHVLITGEAWESKTLHFPAGAIIDAVLTLNGMAKDTSDGESNEGFSTNGRQWDWWQKFVHEGKKYTLSGSGYHGGHSFHVADE